MNLALLPTTATVAAARALFPVALLLLASPAWADPPGQAPAAIGQTIDLTGTLEVIQVCYLAESKSERQYELIEDGTGNRHQLKFQTEPGEGHLTGERVRVHGHRQGGEVTVPAAGPGRPDMEVLAAAPLPGVGRKPGTAVVSESLYGGGMTGTTDMRETLVMLLNYTNSAPYLAADIVTFSNKFFAATGSSVNTCYLEGSYGAVGFAGRVIICNIAADQNVCNHGDWRSKGDAAAVAQGETPASYNHKVYICSGACGWAGLAAVGGNWSMDFYTDGGTICHELGHNLGFAHAASEWGNTGSVSEYGDSSDSMGSSYNWRHNNAPHKIQKGWLTAQTLTLGGAYQIGPIEHVPGTIPFPQVLKINATSPSSGWPYYFSYKQAIGFDSAVGGTYAGGLSIHRWGGGGGQTRVVAVLADGGTYTDNVAGWTVTQISHDTNAATIVLTTYPYAPSPADGDHNIALQPGMSWRASDPAYQFEVFLGTNYPAVALATTNSPEYQGRVASPAFTPAAQLLPGVTYYWRVDQWLAGTKLATGGVWRFATAVDMVHSGLKLHLTFDQRDTSGATTWDLAGPPFEDGALYNAPASATGPVNEALTFNGSSQYAQTPALNLNSASATFTMWLKRNGSQTSYTGLAYCRGGSTVSGFNFTTGNQLGYTWNNDANTVYFNSGLVPPDGQWALAALVVSTSRAIFYLGTTSGTLAAVTNNNPHAMQAFNAPLYVASDPYGGRYFKGAMDDVCVWSRALSRAEITTLFTNGLAGDSLEGPAAPPPPGSFTWTGNSDVFWTNTANWATNAVPGSGDIANFDSSSTQNMATQLGQDLSVAGVSVTGPFRAAGIGGLNTLTLGAGGVQLSNSAIAFDIDAPVAISGTGNFSVAEPATLSLTRSLSGNAGVLKTGSGTLALACANTYTGATMVAGGILEVRTNLVSVQGSAGALAPGAVLWLDAADLTTLQTNFSGGVYAWTNKGTAGGNWTQDSSGAQPVCTNGGSAFNNLNVLKFSAAQALTNLADFANTGKEIHVFVVGNRRAQVNNSGIISFRSALSSADWNSPYSQVLGDRGAASQTLSATRNSGDQPVVNLPANGTTFVVDYYDKADGTAASFLNGANSLTSGTSGDFSINYVAVGGRFAAATATALSAGSYWDGQIAEILVYTNALSVADRQSVEAHLMDKWGISPLVAVGGLPAGTAVDLTGGSAVLSLTSLTSQTIGPLAGVAGSQVWLGGASLTTSNASACEFAGSITGTGTLTKKGSGAFTMSGTASDYAGTSLTAGSLWLGADNTLPPDSTLTVSGSAAFYLNGRTQRIADLIYGGGGASYRNGSVATGTLVISGSGNTQRDPGYLGDTAVATNLNYNLVLQGAGANNGYGLAAWGNNNKYTGATTVRANASLGMANAGQSWANPPVAYTPSALILDGGALGNQGSVAPVVTANQGITLTTNGGYLFAGWSQPVTFNSRITGPGALGILYQNTAGAVILGGLANDYSGDTIVGVKNVYGWYAGNGTVLRLGTNNALPFGAGKGNLNLAYADSLLDLNARTANINGLSGGGQVDNKAAGAAVLIAGNGDASSTFSGALMNTAGTLALTKVGTGQLTLTGASSHNGATIVSNGTLQVNGSLASGSAMTVASAGALGGTGTVAGTVTVNGTLSPGAGVGTLTTGAETWNSGGRYICEITATNVGGADLLNVTAALNVQASTGSPFTLKLVSLTSSNTPGPVANFSKFASCSWIIATAGGGVLNFAADKFGLDTSAFSNDFSGGSFALAQSGNSLALRYSAVPTVPPGFTGISSSGGGIQMGGTGAVGQAYILLATTNLAPANWQPLATNVANTNGVFQFSDSSNNAPQRFYRIQGP